MKKKFLLSLILLGALLIVISLFLIPEEKRYCSSGCSSDSECEWHETRTECPAVQKPGDICFQYFECKIADGKCIKDSTPEYEDCLNCISNCTNESSGKGSPECFKKCWDKFEKE